MYTYEKQRPVMDDRSVAQSGGKERYRAIFDAVPVNIRKMIGGLTPKEMDDIEEFRLKAGAPFIVYGRNQSAFVTRDGKTTLDRAKAYTVTPEDTEKALQLMCDCSVYSIMDELREGYITIRGGHRVGVVGKVVTEGGRVKTIKEISGLNIRVSRQVIGCGSSLMPHIVRGREGVYNTLIISPPQCGKTTLLRDIIRQLSDGVPALGFFGVKVGVVDERSELAGCYRGIPQNRVGIRTDVLDSCPKAQGIMMLIRAMSPAVIATDELGREEDLAAVREALNAGVNIVTTVHGWNMEDVLRKPVIGKLLCTGVFERAVVLSRRRGPGTVEQVIDMDNKQTIRGNWGSLA
ncbi:MAG: stage III sporulation protein AA [Clostridia bacterium]|jgi:stage III sporulation protein AA